MCFQYWIMYTAGGSLNNIPDRNFLESVLWQRPEKAADKHWKYTILYMPHFAEKYKLQENIWIFLWKFSSSMYYVWFLTFYYNLYVLSFLFSIQTFSLCLLFWSLLYSTCTSLLLFSLWLSFCLLWSPFLLCAFYLILIFCHMGSALGWSD